MGFSVSSGWEDNGAFSHISNAITSLREVFTFKPSGSDFNVFSWENSDPSQIAIKLIDQLFFIDSYYETITFLKSNHHLLSIILSAYLEIQKRFEGSFSLKLELDSEEDMLYLLIISNNDSDTAYKNLDTLDQEWWIHNVNKSKGKMNIDLELE
ncbi:MULTISPECIES: hypothetical protein [Bacillaceae]|uniref:Uncharacterized protein n=1 Tax=Evansella alkalicola TaxID=745819 RepID=A0ABS6JX61_9BACI|nr:MULTISPECIES: hypothetical protein [Bacillaceae]MBU9723156.1 hypothetical protein [Bacillus alkalicola]